MRDRSSNDDDNSNSDESDDAELDERVEALFDLLVAAGQSSTDNVELGELSQLLSGHDMKDLPEEPQPYDRPVERLIAVLETCRSIHDDEENLDNNKERPKKSKPDEGRSSKRRSVSRSNSRRKISSSPEKTASKTATTTSQQKDVALQDQFDKEYNSTQYPKIGPGYSDTISVVSDLTTPTVMTGLTIPEEEKDYHGYYAKPASLVEARSYSRDLTLRPPRRSLNRRRGGAAAQRRMHHQATLGRLGEDSVVIPESRPVRNTSSSYPSLRESPNAFPSVFPSDDLSSSLPRSPRHLDTKRLLKKGDASPKKQQQRVISTKRSNGSSRILARKQQPRNDSREKKHQPSNNNSKEKVDVDGVLNVIGQDIDYLFQELSALEEGDDDAPPLEEESVVSESNLSTTAKIKYTLGSVARSLRNDNEEKTKSKSNSRPRARSPANSSRSSSVTQKSDPLIIDEDGFIIHDNGEDPFHPNNEEINLIPPSPERPQQQRKEAPFENSFFGSLRKQDSVNRKSSASRGKSSDRRKSDHPKTTELSSKSNRQASRSKSASRSSRGSRDSSHKKDSRSEETATTAPSTGNAKETSSSDRIDGVEAATKQRIDMLRKLVEEDQDNHAIATKLDFVEAETMKQIARLRDRLEENGEQQKPELVA